MATHQEITQAAQALAREASVAVDAFSGAPRTDSDSIAQAAFREIMSRLAGSAYAGHGFAKGWITEAFGNEDFDEDGEEFGRGKTLPADRAAVDARIAAVTGQAARSILRNLADQA